MSVGGRWAVSLLEGRFASTSALSGVREFWFNVWHSLDQPPDLSTAAGRPPRIRVSGSTRLRNAVAGRIVVGRNPALPDSARVTEALRRNPLERPSGSSIYVVPTEPSTVRP